MKLTSLTFSAIRHILLNSIVDRVDDVIPRNKIMYDIDMQRWNIPHRLLPSEIKGELQEEFE